MEAQLEYVHTFGANLHASELSRKFIKSALLVG